MIFKKILIAVDNSAYSSKAACKGLELAEQLGAQVALVYVIETARMIDHIDAGITPNETLALLKKEAQHTFEELDRINRCVQPVNFMPEGKPAAEIIHTAEDWQADLIVMGTHGRTGLKHLLMGSVAEQVLRSSRIPIIIVP